jgi:hypothetical protein
MDEALSISEKDYEVIENTFLNEIIAKTPFEVCCFPFAQHFYTTSIPMGHTIQNKADLVNRITEINKMDITVKSLETHPGEDKRCSGYCFSYSCKNRCHLKDKS